MEILLVGAGFLTFAAYREKLADLTAGQSREGEKNWIKDEPGHINEAIDPWVQENKRRQRNYQVEYRDRIPVDNPSARVFNERLEAALYYDPYYQASFAANYALQTDQDHNLLQVAKMKYPYNVVKQRVDWIGGDDSMSVFCPAFDS